MSGYFGTFTPGGTHNQYNSTYATPGFPSAPYVFNGPAAPSPYTTSYQQNAPGTTRPDGTSGVYQYGSRPADGGYGPGAPPIYASSLSAAAASGVAASVLAAGLSAAATKTAIASIGPTISASTKMPTSTAASGGSSTYTGYDAAVYAAATSYLQSKASGGASQWLGLRRSNASTTNNMGGGNGGGGGGGGGGYGGGGGGGGGGGYGGGYGSSSGGGGFGGGRPSFPRKGPQHQPQAPRQPQLHYCDVCKISCAGPQTYREHLEGQKHKKKEALAQGAETQPLAKAKASFRCDLCSVTCTGHDTYNAHIRGAKHQKTVKLHQTLGKPIPSNDPIIIPPVNAQKLIAESAGAKKIVGVSKVAFVGGQKLTTTGMISSSDAASTDDKEVDPSIYLAMEKEIQPVGEDYVELVKTEDGKSTTYHCKLCDCRFNDMNAKDMHLKGRRHRLQFKKKVNPQLEVEMKASNRREEKPRFQQRDGWAPQGMFPSSMMGPPVRAHGPVPLFGGNGGKRQNSLANDENDQYVLTKHALIYPSDDETRGISTMVTNVERALKIISDQFAAEDNVKKEEPSAEESPEKVSETPKSNRNAADDRLLKGAMRVGVMADGLLLRGEPNVELVVLCSDKPTVPLLEKVAELLPRHLSAITNEEYELEKDIPEAAISVTSATDKITVTVSLTSVTVRGAAEGEAANKPDPIDVLDKQKCLEALARLRRAKWFQAKCMNLQSCSIVLRLLRDLCQRVPTWMPLSNWATELLVEKVLSSAGVPLGPGEAFRRVFEAIAVGILLPGGTGLFDPCEKEPTDAAVNMAIQQREDITASAQHALRLIAFNRIHQVLGMERAAIKMPSAESRKRPLASEEKMDEGESEAPIEPKKAKADETDNE